MKKSEPERPFVYTTKDTLGNMVCNKTSGNDGFASEFYGAFWSELKTLLLVRYKKRFLPDKFSISQKQAIIRLIVKRQK